LIHQEVVTGDFRLKLELSHETTAIYMYKEHISQKNAVSPIIQIAASITDRSLAVGHFYAWLSLGSI